MSERLRRGLVIRLPSRNSVEPRGMKLLKQFYTSVGTRIHLTAHYLRVQKKLQRHYEVINEKYLRFRENRRDTSSRQYRDDVDLYSTHMKKIISRLAVLASLKSRFVRDYKRFIKKEEQRLVRCQELTTEEEALQFVEDHPLPDWGLALTMDEEYQDMIFEVAVDCEGDVDGVENLYSDDDFEESRPKRDAAGFNRLSSFFKSHNTQYHMGEYYEQFVDEAQLVISEHKKNRKELVAVLNPLEQGRICELNRHSSNLKKATFLLTKLKEAWRTYNATWKNVIDEQNFRLSSGLSTMTFDDAGSFIAKNPLPDFHRINSYFL